MKTKKPLFLLGMLFLLMQSNSQELIISKQKVAQSYNQQNKKISPTESSKINSKFDSYQTTYIDNLAYYPDQISDDLKETTDYDFFQGIQNPHDPKIWIYMERKEIGAGFNLKMYNTSDKKSETLIRINNRSRTEIAYKPIGWTRNANELFLEGLYLDTADEHEGIWIFNLETKKLSKVEIAMQLMRTPIISEDRNSMFFVGTLDNKIDKLHGNTDIVYEFNIQSKNLNTIAQSKGESFIINGFRNQLVNPDNNQNSLRASLLDYYLPWDFGKNNCVSRHGTPEPTGTHINQGRCNIFSPGGQHGYAAVDFATSQSSDENVRAAASGIVSFAGISGSLTSGYGRLVIITHSDGTRTYYAHNTVILVSEGQTVTKGQILAREGTTVGSTGDHIHFEWRAAGGNASTIGNFKDIGQPRVDYIYRSNNATQANNIPTLTAPASAASVAAPVNLTWTSSISGASYRLQVSKVSTGWTAANGFTTDASSNANTPVNYSAAGLLSYAWPNADTATANKPVVGSTYYWTVRSFSTATGTSSYTPVRSFKVTSLTARLIEESLVSTNEILVYPNPAKDILNIETSATNHSNFQIEVIDFQSRIVLKETSKIPTVKLNIGNLKNGYYILKITGDKINKTQTININH